MKWGYKHIVVFLLGVGVFSCAHNADQSEIVTPSEVPQIELLFDKKVATLQDGESQPFDIIIPKSGRYQVEVQLKSVDSIGTIWVEDYIHNTDDRTYNVTGNLNFTSTQLSLSKDGSPLRKGKHEMRLNVSKGTVEVEKIKFILLKEHSATSLQYQQNMSGNQWELIWSDEFEGSGLPDTSKWDYNIGNWGWGNNELQYYTALNKQNARLENGNLIIEAHKENENWTSARLTTQGKESFLYGKIEFRAKVPSARGTWAAGWLLGDEYVDELSWPYCGEIDVLECVGFEINDSTGNGLNHATCHTRSYYFKQGNQIGSEIAVENMKEEFHTYAIEWYPHEIKAFLDGKHYYTYDKNANDLEWPFNQPQNIIINLAIGGGWGGAKGIDDNWTSHQYVLDYVRVYELTKSEKE